jgi:PAS domain S-box-containing protein
MATGFIKSVIEVSHVDFSWYDLKNHAMLYSSGLASKILGYSDEEMKTFAKDYNRKIIHPDDIEVVDAKLEEIKNSEPGQVIETIVRYKRKDGRYIWGYTRKIVSERDESGNPSKITTVAQDISELVSIQEELDRCVAELDRISYRNAHELRGPVASILGLTNLLRDKGFLDGHLKEIINHLGVTVMKLDSVVSDLSKPSADEDV